MAKSFRIVSLCPSTTFHLFDLNLGDQIVGRTKFCIEPKNKVEMIQKVGGTKTPKFDLIRSLKPSHIMFNREENDIEHLEKIKSIGEAVITTPVDIAGSIEQNRLFAKLFNCEVQASKIENEISHLLQQIETTAYKPFTYLYFIWNDPYMLAGKVTYIDYILSLFGGKNAAAKISKERYPQFTKEQIKSLTVDRVFLSSEPFPYKEKHLAEYQFAGKNVQLIDGQALSWHGSFARIGLNYCIDFFRYQKE